MVRTLLLLAFVTVGCIQAPPVERYPVAVSDDAPSAGSSAPAGGSTSGGTTAQGEPNPGQNPSANPAYGTPGPQPAEQRVTEFGLVFGNDTAWLQTRTTIRSGTLVNAGLYFSEDDFIFDIGILRMGRTNQNSPLSLGAGVGFYAGSLADPLDYVSAIVLTGIATYQLGSSYPTRLTGQVSYAPDVTTFGDGDSLMDARAGLEVELGASASVIVGYRFFEIGVDEMEDRELEDGAFVGVRLGF